MQRVEIFDTTLRDGEQSPGAAMAPSARFRLAHMLAAARVDTIEAGFPAASPLVARSVGRIARSLRSTRVAALARCLERDIDAAAEALNGAAQPRIHVFIATSPIHLKHKLRISPDNAIAMAVEAVRYARRRCSDIEFSAEDATRSDPVFLAKIFAAVIRAGASVINVPDTVGYATPAEIDRLVRYLFLHVDRIEDAQISVHTHDDLGMATANALAAVKMGATQVECTINGIGERAGNAALEEIVMALRTRGDFFGCETAFDTKALPALSNAVARATRMQVQKNKAIVGANAFAHESGIHQDGMLKKRATYEIIDPAQLGTGSRLPLGRNSGRHALLNRVAELGLRFVDGAQEQFEQAFLEFAQHRRSVTDDDVLELARAAGADIVGAA